MRRKSKEVNIGKIKIGGENPIAVQSMLSIPSYNIEESILQAKRLKAAGCDILRIAIPDLNAVKLIGEIKENVDIPLVADIHFDYKLAVESAHAGIDKIRINPGNIPKDHMKEITKACRERNIPIRVGVNAGSLEKYLVKNENRAEAMVKSAMDNIKILESLDFNDIVVSLKSSDVKICTDAYRIMAEKCDYPLHLGITETGTKHMGTIKSAIGIGSLLLDGIGDTIRVSLTEDPTEEVKCGIDILKSLGLRKGISFVSCPTCGRTRINLIKLAKEAEKALENNKSDLKIAIMGCVVNGPGEAKDADIGIAGADGMGVIFKKGKVIKTVKEEDLLSELIFEVNQLTQKGMH